MLSQLTAIISVVLEVIKLARQIQKENKIKIKVNNDIKELEAAFKERDADKLNKLFNNYGKTK